MQRSIAHLPDYRLTERTVSAFIQALKRKVSSQMQNYEGHDLKFSYCVEPGYWTFYLKIKVDDGETLRSMTYSLPDKLKIVRYFIEDIPVRIITNDAPYIHVYWGSVAIGLDAKETVNIQSTLDYIRIYLS